MKKKQIKKESSNKSKAYSGSEIFRTEKIQELNDNQKTKVKGGFITIDVIDGI